MSKQVLLIDDEPDIREVAALTLEMVAGWTTSEAGSGAEGIAKAVARPPDAILLDVMMPGMDGPTTFERLKAISATAGIPVILLTAKVQSVDRQRFAELGVKGVIIKPFDPLLLADEVTRLLGW